MTKQQIDYSKTVIYRISCNDLPEFIYIGSTTEFTKRKCQHKCSSKSSESPLYKTIRNFGGWENWRMIVVEQYLDCQNKIEQKIREQKWIDDLNANLNINKAYVTEEQAKLKNNECCKEYYEQNIEKIIEYQKEYRENNKEKIKEYRDNNKDQQNEQKKIYYNQNKEKIKIYKKEYYQKKKIITL
jgi:hypothetical protein